MIDRLQEDFSNVAILAAIAILFAAAVFASVGFFVGM
jgi:hypothetical protein